MTNRGTWVYRNGRLVEKHGPDDVRPEVARSHLPTPMIIGDHLPDLIGPGGKHYSSKSELRREYKARGLVELGNDAPTAPVDNAKPLSKNEIGEALQKVKQGYRPAPLEYGAIPIADE